MLKRLYKWMNKHYIGVVRYLYISPIVAVLFCNERLFQAVILLDCAISITLQYGVVLNLEKKGDHHGIEKA